MNPLGLTAVATLVGIVALPGHGLIRIPPGFDGAVVDEPDSVPIEDVDAGAARKAADAAGKQANLRWLFRAFDDTHLYFSVARMVASAEKGRRPWLRLAVIRRLRVVRSTDAENRLNVRSVIDDYERPQGGIRAGMSPDEVRRALGEPTRIEQLGPVGSFDFIYPQRRVRFLGGKVAIPNAP